MRFPRFSVADLLRAVLLCALGMACLIFPSSPWGGAVFSFTLGVLTLALLGICYRRGDRRAFWTGFALCGWTYLALSSGPWFVTYVRPHLVTSKVLEWAYPWLIPVARQASNPRHALRPFVVPPAALEEGLTVQDLKNTRVDVWVRKEGVTVPSLLAEGVQTVDDTASGNLITGPTVMIDADQFARLSEAKAYSRKFILRPNSPGPLAPLWSNPPVDPADFENVGHPLFALLCGWIGSLVGRHFLATRELAPRAEQPQR